MALRVAENDSEKHKSSVNIIKLVINKIKATQRKQEIQA